MSPLVELLKEEVSLLEELQQLLEKDREAAVQATPEALEELLESNKRKETLLLKIRMVEEGRRRLPPGGEEVAELEERVRELASSIGEQGMRNRLLFEGSLQLIRSMLGVLMPQGVYDAQGRLKGPEPSRPRGRV